MRRFFTGAALCCLVGSSPAFAGFELAIDSAYADYNPPPDPALDLETAGFRVDLAYVSKSFGFESGWGFSFTSYSTNGFVEEQSFDTGLQPNNPYLGFFGRISQKSGEQRFGVRVALPVANQTHTVEDQPLTIAGVSLPLSSAFGARDPWLYEIGLGIVPRFKGQWLFFDRLRLKAGVEIYFIIPTSCADTDLGTASLLPDPTFGAGVQVRPEIAYILPLTGDTRRGFRLVGGLLLHGHYVYREAPDVEDPSVIIEDFSEFILALEPMVGVGFWYCAITFRLHVNVTDTFGQSFGEDAWTGGRLLVQLDIP